MDDAPAGTDRDGKPSGAAPTGQGWKAEETEEGCGRSGLRWVLVDETCGDGEGSDPSMLEAPMFRDGALIGDRLFAVDATHLWGLDLSVPDRIARTSLLTGIGQPLAIQAQSNRLYVAAGADGLVVVDAADPAHPSRQSSLTLPAPAFDVELRSGVAYVAMGHSGVAAVDISGAVPTLVKTIATSGHAAGVTTDADNVYVAACTSFSIHDRTTGALRGSVPFPKVGERLLTPAKDVAVVGNVAFVAAGAQGAVAIDVSNPASPSVIGHCAVKEEGFYASGVRAEGSALFIAAGEWGVLRVDVSNPQAACTQPLAKLSPPKPDNDCSKKPPWQLVPWQEVWSPPPPGRDPIQVLPAGNRLYAFGDARRIGVRAVEVRASADLAKVSRYDEPRTVLGIAASGSKVVVIGPRGGVFAADPQSLLVRTATAGDEVLLDASAVTTLSDGRYVALSSGKVFVEGATHAVTFAATAIAARGLEVVVTKDTVVERYATDGTRSASAPLDAEAALPLSIAASADSVFYAAPEWVAATGRAVTTSGFGLPGSVPHTIFDLEDSLDIDLWRIRVPRRHLAVSSGLLVELAALGTQAGIAVHHADGTIAKVALPALTYAGLASDATHAYAIGIDRGLYKSYLVTVDLSGAPKVVSVEVFTGAASGVATANNRVYVADADGAVRIYGVAGANVSPLGVVRVEERP